MGVVLSGLVVFFAVSTFGYPYGRIRAATGGSIIPSTYAEDPAGVPRRKPASSKDMAAAPGLALYPPALLVKAVADMALLSATDSDPGLRLATTQVLLAPRRLVPSRRAGAPRSASRGHRISLGGVLSL
jgi:hypothetical protein